MSAAEVSRAGRHVILGSILLGSIALLAGCASNEPLAYDPAAVQAQAAADERPAFFLEWKGGDLPGLTQKPALDRTSELPEYPSAAKRKREQGTTVLNACVTADGRLVDVHLSKSSGYPALDQATVSWAKKARYKPAMFGTEALAVCNFQLEWVWQVKIES